MTELDADVSALVATEGSLTRDAIVAACGRVAGPEIVIDGDSLNSQGGGLTPPVNPAAYLATYTGRTVHTNAVGGETSVGIAARQGGNPWTLLPEGGSIPTSGGVTVTLANANGGFQWPLLQTAGNPSLGQVMAGALAGVPGTLSLTQPSGASSSHRSDDYYTFTRTTAGSVVGVTRPTAFYSDFAKARRGDIHIIQAGKNDCLNPTGFTHDQAIAQVLANVAAMVAYLEASEVRYLIVGVHNGTGEGSDNAGMYARYVDLNAALQARYGRRFLDYRTYLIAYGLEDAAITPTSNDTTDIAVDTVPRSLLTDGTHFQIVARQILAKLEAGRLAELGWLGDTPPPPAWSLGDDFSRADSADLGPLWDIQSSFGIVSNKLTPSDTSGTVDMSLLAATIPSPDHRVSASIARGGSSTTGVVVRATDAANYYGVRVNATGNVLIYKLVAGATTSLAGVDGMGWVDGAKLGLSVAGNTFTAYINDVAVITTTHTDATLAGGVKAGVRSGSAATKPTFDNFTVTPS